MIHLPGHTRAGLFPAVSEESTTPYLERETVNGIDKCMKPIAWAWMVLLRVLQIAKKTIEGPPIGLAHSLEFYAHAWRPPLCSFLLGP